MKEKIKSLLVGLSERVTLDISSYTFERMLKDAIDVKQKEQ